jgi:cyclophilin family peptidyl-prolyl cis-trans isomerase
MPSRHLITAFSFLFLCGSPLASAATQAPAAPSNLTVKALGVNSFLVKWKDNSTNETGWEIRVSRKGGTPKRYALVPTPDATSYIVTTNELPNMELVFQMASYTGVIGTETLSKPTPAVRVKTPASNTFGTPTMLVAKALDDGRIRLTWVDKSTSELGYQIESRIGKKKWTPLGSVGPGIKFKILTTGYAPKETRAFRVRAFKSTKFTSFSNVATATTKSFQAPASLEVTALAEGAFSYKWKDRSAVEGGFELEAKVGDGNFESLGTVPANSTDTDPVPGFTLDANHEFRIRAYRLVGNVKTDSGFSNVVAIRSTPLNTPSALAGTAASATSVNLTWVDKSSRETGHEILYRAVGSSSFTSAFAAANAQSFTINNLDSAATYEFRVSAVVNGFFGNRIATSAYQSVQVRTKEGFTGNFNPPIVAGASFLYPIQITSPSAVIGLTVTGLPDGLTFNPADRTITGFLTIAGTYTATLTATFADGSTATRSLSLKAVLSTPTVVQPFATVNAPVATPNTVSITGKFSDPDTASAARVTTTLGAFDIILFPTSKPQTVDNFLDYTDAGEYDNSFFHRSPANFVVQGGGYKHTLADGFTKVKKFDRVLPNEPGLSNVRGTVAMAKIGGDPDSATSEWFVNVNDNSSNLDAQNGGFTVFGRVPTAGMVVVDQINALPVHDYNVTIGADSQLLQDLPVNAVTAQAVLDPAQLVKITSVGPAPILTYQVTSKDPAIATASLAGSDITITGVATGSTTIEVKATDLDGLTVTQNIAVTVP